MQRSASQMKINKVDYSFTTNPLRPYYMFFIFKAKMSHKSRLCASSKLRTSWWWRLIILSSQESTAMLAAIFRHSRT